MPLANRRSSDPSLNEKWQEHRRSMELSSLSNPGDDPYEADSLELGTASRIPAAAEINVAIDVAEGQMVNILQEATKEDTNPIEPLRSSKMVLTTVEVSVGLSSKQHKHEIPAEDLKRDIEDVAENPFLGTIGLPKETTCADLKRQPKVELEMEQNEAIFQRSQGRTPPLTTSENHLIDGIVKNTRECISEYDSESPLGTPLPSPPTSLPAHSKQEMRLFNMESSTDALTGEGVCLENWDRGPCLPTHKEDDASSSIGLSESAEASHETHGNLVLSSNLEFKVNRTSQVSDGGLASPFPCALNLSNFKGLTVCNGELETENRVMQKPLSLHSPLRPLSSNRHGVNGDESFVKSSLSRQLLSLSCGSSQCHWRNLPHKLMDFNHPGKNTISSSPDQPTRNHLDDDGMPIYMDVVQQRLRQIETGHQQEVETLKRQVQELRSRLESQYLNSSQQINGEFGDEVTAMALLSMLPLTALSTDLLTTPQMTVAPPSIPSLMTSATRPLTVPLLLLVHITLNKS